MYRTCICFTLLLAASSGFRFDLFAETTDFNRFFDNVLSSMITDFPPDIHCSPLNLDIRRNGTNSSETVASFSSSNCTIGDFHSLKRASPVVPYLSFGNLSLSTSVSVGQLSVNYTDSAIEVMGLNIQASVRVFVMKNEFDLNLTVYSASNGSCAVDLEKAKFTTISDIYFNLNSLGFFNQINLISKIDHLVKTVLDELIDDIQRERIRKILEVEICSQVIQ